MTPQRREILAISIPSVLESLFTTMASMIDSKMVSAMGITAISAVSVTNQPRLFLLSIFFAINTTVAALTARRMGTKDRAEINRLLVTALIATAILGTLAGILCAVLAEPIMILCSNQPDTLASSVLYFRVTMGAIVFQTLFMVINAAFRGSGNTRLTLVSNVVFCLVNLFMNYLLIEGHWGFPALGILGAAIATVSGTVAAAAVCFAFLLRPSAPLSLTFCIREKLAPTRACLLDMADMWKKILSENVFTRVGFLLTGMIAAHTGSFSMSVYSVGMHLMNINFALGSGLSSAAVALVGRSQGAGETDNIREYSRQILRMGAVASLFLSAVFILFGRPYYGFFGDEAEFIRVGALSCIIIGIVSPIQTHQIIYNGIFHGVGDVRYTMLAAIFSVTVVNTLVSFTGTVLLEGGVWGIWAGVFASQAIRMLLLRRRYHSTILGGTSP